MTIQQLNYVIALDVHRHFIKAAKSCSVAQPTLTLQLKKLEEEISTVIFDRNQQPLVPTPMGKIFIAKARRIIQEIEELKNLVNEDKNQMKGEFRLGIIPTLASNLLPLFICDFCKNHKETHLIIEELQSEEIIEGLEQKQLDLGILSTPLNEGNIREIPIFYEPFLIYGDKEQEILKKGRVDKNDLRPEGLWLMRKEHCFRNQTLNICDFDIPKDNRNLTMEASGVETIKKMIQNSSGYTLIPELSFNHKNDDSNIIRFRDPQPVREISIVVNKYFTKEQLITELRKYILANTPDSFKKNKRFITIKWR